MSRCKAVRTVAGAGGRQGHRVAGEKEIFRLQALFGVPLLGRKLQKLPPGPGHGRFPGQRAVQPSRPGATCLLRALRDAYEAELKNAAAYDAAAGALPALRELFRKLAARERAHAAALRGMIARTIV